MKIAARTKAALSGDVAVAERPQRATAPQGATEVRLAQVSIPEYPAVAVTKDALDALAIGPVKDVIALMLWKWRHMEPEMAMQITEHDIGGFRACAEYLGVVPEVRIVRPQGMPAHEGFAATRTRGAIPPQPATPPRPYVIVSLVERGTENAIRAVENNEKDFEAAEEAKRFRNARDNALRLAAEVQREIATGNFSTSTLNDAAQCLVALAK